HEGVLEPAPFVREHVEAPAPGKFKDQALGEELSVDHHDRMPALVEKRSDAPDEADGALQDAVVDEAMFRRVGHVADEQVAADRLVAEFPYGEPVDGRRPAFSDAEICGR